MSSSERLDQAKKDMGQEEDEPELSFGLEEDPNRKDQLFTFRKEQPVTTKDYRPSEQQLLREGKLGDAEFSARLRNVIFSTYDGQPACLICFQVNFATVKKGWFRFRNATIEVQFEKAGTDVGSDGEGEDNGPLVCKFYPELIRGHVQTAAETYGLGFEIPISPPGVGAGVSASWNVTAPREGLHLIHGRLMGDPETKVKWTMNENEVSKGGIYEQPMFAVIVRHAQGRPFAMTLKVKATTYGGLPVRGNGGSRISFKPAKAEESPTKKVVKPTSRLTGGSFEVGDQQWTSAQRDPEPPSYIDGMDLESLTQMRSTLLSPQGPGAGNCIFSSSLA